MFLIWGVLRDASRGMEQLMRVNGEQNDDRRKIRLVRAYMYTNARVCEMYPWGSLDPFTATLPLI